MWLNFVLIRSKIVPEILTIRKRAVKRICSKIKSSATNGKIRLIWNKLTQCLLYIFTIFHWFFSHPSICVTVIEFILSVCMSYRWKLAHVFSESLCRNTSVIHEATFIPLVFRSLPLKFIILKMLFVWIFIILRVNILFCHHPLSGVIHRHHPFTNKGNFMMSISLPTMTKARTMRDVSATCWLLFILPSS